MNMEYDNEDQMTYGIWCTVSGGVTGHRESWLKNADGQTKTFSDYDAAQDEASDLTLNSRNGRAMFSYRVRPIRAN